LCEEKQLTDFTYRQLTEEEKWISAYEAFVKDLSEGYDMSIYEYSNDISCRQRIEESRMKQPVADQWKRVQSADAALKKILIQTKRCIHGDYPKTCFWYWGYPPNSPELGKDLKAMEAI
jgi:hypothetical protein